MDTRQMVIDRSEQVKKLIEFEQNKETLKRRIYPVYYSEKLPLYKDELAFLKSLYQTFPKQDTQP